MHRHAAGAKLGLSLRSEDGVVEVLVVAAGSAAAAAGLVAGQRLLSVEGTTLTLTLTLTLNPNPNPKPQP